MTAELRLAVVRRRLGEAKQPTEAAADAIEEKMLKIAGRAGFASWEEHYSAAQVYAIAMLTSGVDDPTNAKLATAAVKHLERAVARADQEYLAAQQDWILSEDPDLDALRTTRQFAEFEMRHLHRSAPVAPRPRGIRQWEVARYAVDLVAAAAHMQEVIWRRRAASVSQSASSQESSAEQPAHHVPNVAVLREWNFEDDQALSLIQRVAADHRHWPTRLNLIESMRDWEARYAAPSLDARFPRWEPPLDPAETDNDQAVLREVTGFEQTLGRIADLLARTEAGVTALEADAGTTPEQTHKTGPFDRIVISETCRDRVRFWSALRRWVDPSEREASPDALWRRLTKPDDDDDDDSDGELAAAPLSRAHLMPCEHRYRGCACGDPA